MNDTAKELTYRRQVFLLLADHPEVRLTPIVHSERSWSWRVSVPSIDLVFSDGINSDSWSGLFIYVRSAVAAYDAFYRAEQEAGYDSLTVEI